MVSYAAEELCGFCLEELQDLAGDALRVRRRCKFNVAAAACRHGTHAVEGTGAASHVRCSLGHVGVGCVTLHDVKRIVVAGARHNIRAEHQLPVRARPRKLQPRQRHRTATVRAAPLRLLHAPHLGHAVVERRQLRHRRRRHAGHELNERPRRTPHRALDHEQRRRRRRRSRVRVQQSVRLRGVVEPTRLQRLGFQRLQPLRHDACDASAPTRRRRSLRRSLACAVAERRGGVARLAHHPRHASHDRRRHADARPPPPLAPRAVERAGGGGLLGDVPLHVQDVPAQQHQHRHAAEHGGQVRNAAGEQRMRREKDGGGGGGHPHGALDDQQEASHGGRHLARGTDHAAELVLREGVRKVPGAVRAAGAPAAAGCAGVVGHCFLSCLRARLARSGLSCVLPVSCSCRHSPMKYRYCS
eukprot:Rhum_TRINITY_DN14638_c12_g1::Rhum_TRINITY_DN14638_c12_g1_i1::g.105532::m.105532